MAYLGPRCPKDILGQTLPKMSQLGHLGQMGHIGLQHTAGAWSVYQLLFLLLTTTALSDTHLWFILDINLDFLLEAQIDQQPQNS